MGAAIFICYRREDSGWPASRLFDTLTGTFGSDRIFKDLDTHQPGENFVEKVQAALNDSIAVLALIGARWANVQGARGIPRLHEPDVYVRMEISLAIEKKVLLIPVLIDNAQKGTGYLFDTNIPQAIEEACFESRGTLYM